MLRARGGRFEKLPFPHDLPDIVSRDTGYGRFYDTPEGTFPSVTTVLGRWPSPGLDAWRASIGEEEAARVSRRAADRGTVVHELLEDYVDGEDVELGSYEVAELFNAFKRCLDPGLTGYYAQELRLYSKVLGIAGRMDLLGEWRGIPGPSVIDFKTASGTDYSNEDKIESYFLQTGGYASMLWERIQLRVRSTVLLVASLDSGKAKVLTRPFTGDTIAELKRRIEYAEATL